MFDEVRVVDLGKTTHTIIPCCMPKLLPPRNHCAGWFAPAWVTGASYPLG